MFSPSDSVDSRYNMSKIFDPWWTVKKERYQFKQKKFRLQSQHLLDINLTSKAAEIKFWGSGPI